MSTRKPTLPLRLPPLSDEAASEIHQWLSEFLYLFEARYFCQLRNRSDGPLPPSPFEQDPEPAEIDDFDGFDGLDDDYPF